MSDAIRLAFDALAAGKVPAWLAPLRRAGMDRFAEVGIPGTRDEEWRFTPIAPIARTPGSLRPRRFSRPSSGGR